MKSWIVILMLGLPVAFGSNAVQLYAQHGHGGGVGLGPSGAGPANAGRPEAPGRADTGNEGGALSTHARILRSGPARIPAASWTTIAS